MYYDQKSCALLGLASLLFHLSYLIAILDHVLHDPLKCMGAVGVQIRTDEERSRVIGPVPLICPRLQRESVLGRVFTIQRVKPDPRDVTVLGSFLGWSLCLAWFDLIVWLSGGVVGDFGVVVVVVIVVVVVVVGVVGTGGVSKVCD